MRLYAIAIAACLSSLTCVSWAGEGAEIISENEDINYSIGYQIGADLKGQRVELNAEQLLNGVRDALSAAEPRITPEAMSAILFKLKRRVFAQQQQELLQAAQKNRKLSEAFLAENATKEGTIVLASGLQYRILKSGAGKSPNKDDWVTVHYRGTLLDKTEFDSSYRREEPTAIQVDSVIDGWAEALQLMKEGDKWQLFISPELAYGERGMGARIPPNSLLIFELKLVSIKSDNPL